MIRLDTTTRKLQILLGAAVAANQLPVFVSYLDTSAVAHIGSSNPSLTNGITPVDICAAPAANTVRQIDLLTVVNEDTAAASVTLRFDDGGSYTPLYGVTLAPGSKINYTHAQGFWVTNENGAPQTDVATFQLRAGAGINADDTVQLGPDGKGYRVVTTDYAAVPNCTYGTGQTSTATGQIVALTSVNNAIQTNYHRKSTLIDRDGNIFILSPISNASVGAKVFKYSAKGSLVGTTELAAAGTNYTDFQIIQLSNGNIAALAFTGTTLRMGVYTESLDVVKSPASCLSEQAHTTGTFAVCALTGGGFAVAYQQNSNGLLTRFTTFDNSGNLVTAATTIHTGAGSVGANYEEIAELSNGNLVVALATQCSVNPGMICIILDTVGTVSTTTGLEGASTYGTPSLSVMPGFICMARFNGSSQVGMYVLDNAGTLVAAGTTYSTSQGGQWTNKVVNDGTHFYAVFRESTIGNTWIVKKISTAGTVVSSGNISSGGSPYPMDAFCENGYLVVGDWGDNNRYGFTAMLTSSMTGFSKTEIGTGSYTSNNFMNMIPAGDFSFVLCADTNSLGGAYATRFHVGKYANTAVVGVAKAAAAQDAIFSMYQGAGTYVTNKLKGSPSVAFDMTTGATVYGNQGALLTYGTVLRGM